MNRTDMLIKVDIAALGDNPTANYLAIGTALVVSTLAALSSLFFWLGEDPTRTLEASVPGTDGRPEGLDVAEAPPDLTGVFEAFDGVPSDLPGAWARFRGPDFDNIGKSGPALADSWGDGGPEVQWSVELGEGFAAPAVLNGSVYVLDYDEERRADALRCFSLEDGREIWRRWYGIKIKRNHGMSRTIPAVTEKYIVTIGPKGQVVCLDTATGDYRWGIDLKTEYGTTEPLWYTGQCPIIDNGQAIVAPCGSDVLMMAVDCETGSPVWKTPNPHGWTMSHSSIMPMTLLGKRMYVYCAQGGLVGVSAEGDDLGEVLWEKAWDAKVVAPSPVAVGEDRIFMAAGYGKGSMMLQLSREEGTYSVEVLFETTPKEGLACEQQTPIYHDGLLYGIMPKDAGAMKGQFVCYRPDGTLVWSSGQNNRFGLGPFMLADGKFFILDDDGVLTMLDARKAEYVQLAQASVIDGYDAWGPLALAGSRMLLRDMNKMVCIDVGVAR